MTNTRDHDWNERALSELFTVVRRNALRMARHLEAQCLLHDPRAQLLALAARRLLPLDVSVMRPLRRSDGGVAAFAFHQLASADRAVLWPGRADVDLPPGGREHLASALLRITRNAQAARRSPDAPPGKP